MSSQEQQASPDTPFGARILEAIRREGLPLSGLNYETIQELKRADREAVIRVLREKNSTLPYAMIQRLRTGSPEEIAHRIALDAQRANKQMTTLMLIMMLT